VQDAAQRRALVLTAGAAVLTNASWFSATAVAPALEDDWDLTSAGAAWLVIVVQVGFVIGSIGAAAGMAGAVLAGRLADRMGRTAVTSAAMITSALCCLASPVAFGAALPLLVFVLLVWGASVIADSAQFSAAVTELAEPRYAGSVLALQLALGFTRTIVSCARLGQRSSLTTARE
jgi:MFS family permease